MRLVIVANCVDISTAEAATGGIVTDCVHTFTEAMILVQSRCVDIVVGPDSIGEASSVTGIDLARVCYGYRVPCVIVSDDWEDGACGAAMLVTGGDLREAILRAIELVRAR